MNLIENLEIIHFKSARPSKYSISLLKLIGSDKNINPQHKPLARGQLFAKEKYLIKKGDEPNTPKK
jgi:hypothetical protein